MPHLPVGFKRIVVLSMVALIMVGSRAIAQEPGDPWSDPATLMEFVWVPGGCFAMGCGEWAGDCSADELPVHEVCVDGFWLGKYEVTQGLWEMVMGGNPSAYAAADNHPVDSVSWEDAQAFIAKLEELDGGAYDFRLPTEAEWEYACRSGGADELYAGGDVDGAAWYFNNSEARAHVVGMMAPNGLGFQDMNGNVFEWVQDIYAEDAYASHGRDNPVNEGDGSSRVLRGGGWSEGARYVSCVDRGSGIPTNKYELLGLRILRIE